MQILKDYKKHRWFYTYSGKLVVGGKSALQNDFLINEFKKTNKNYWVMHTKDPGSSFCFVVSEIKNVGESDLNECAIFTGCFSKAWKSGKKKIEVHSFMLSDLYKNKNMKIGTWGIKKERVMLKVKLKLVLVKQKGILRAVPEDSVNKKDILFYLKPGKKDKIKIVEDLLKYKILKNVSKDEILSALPTGGINIRKF